MVMDSGPIPKRSFYWKKRKNSKNISSKNISMLTLMCMFNITTGYIGFGYCAGFRCKKNKYRAIAITINR